MIVKWTQLKLRARQSVTVRCTTVAATMSESETNKPKTPLPPSSSSSSGGGDHGGSTKYSGHKSRHINPPETVNPDSATLRDQWRYAIRQYSKWYSHAWGTAILAGTAFFALGWIIKGENPLPSFHSNPNPNPNPSPSSHEEEEKPPQPKWCHLSTLLLLLPPSLLMGQFLSSTLILFFFLSAFFLLLGGLILILNLSFWWWGIIDRSWNLFLGVRKLSTS